jgi:NDP-sugar pyrophosphorylase family protein
MKLLVLAGGFGTRLQSVLSRLPKALAPIGGAPFLHFQMENWVQQGITSFVFLLHHQSEYIVDFLKQGADSVWRNLDIQWVIEATPLGTGGSIVNAVAELQIHGDFLIANADTWLGSGLTQVVEAGMPAIGVINVTDAGRYGSVAFDAQHNVTHFLEKNKHGGGGWVNAGIARLNASLFRDKQVQTASLESDYFPDWVRVGVLKVAPLDCDFIDIGIPEDYYRFCHWIASGRSEAL